MKIPDIKRAVHILKAGGLVAVPTETVYGLAADASNETAVRQVFLAKERPFHQPLIVHLAHQEQLADWAKEIPDAALCLARAFWPGPVTLVLKKQPHVLDSVTGGQDTVGLRVPAHPVAQTLLQAFGGGMAAPSANKFTRISPTTAQAVREELGDKVDMVLDGGDCSVGLESTIIDLSTLCPVILRPGMITEEAVSRVLGMPLALTRQRDKAMPVPGSHPLHYAPRTRTVLIETAAVSRLQMLYEGERPIALIRYTHQPVQTDNHVFDEKMPDDASGYARELYRVLRKVDGLGVKCIFVEKVPDAPEWYAIQDRLSKACAGR